MPESGDPNHPYRWINPPDAPDVAKPEPASEISSEWDGEIKADAVVQSGDRDHVRTWNYWDGEGGNFEQKVHVVTGSYDPNPDDPDSEAVEVYRWESSQYGFGTTDQGKWTTDRDSAESDGDEFATNSHVSPEDNPARDEEEEDEEEEEEEIPDLGEIDNLSRPAKRNVKLGPDALPKSKASVITASTISDAHADAVLVKFFGGDGASARESLSHSLGMPDDATITIVRVGQSDAGGGTGVRVNVTHPAIKDDAIRFIGVDDDGKRFIKNEFLEIMASQQGKGIATEILSQQIESASANGFDYICCHAAGSKESSYNGYCTWPKMGFDMSLTDDTGGIHPSDEETYQAARNAFPKAKTVGDIFDTKDGKEWWTENGTDLMDARFDLTPGSRAMQKMSAYAAAKQAQKRK